jgi:Tol biopolymer transport system component
VSRDGEISQLTHFGDLYSQFDFGNFASLSPDGRFLAFGLDLDDHSYTEPTELTILDLHNLHVFRTCISFNNTAPLWTPDNRYLVVQHPDSKKRYPSIVVLHVETGEAVNIFTDDNNYRVPSGWFHSRK